MERKRNRPFHKIGDYCHFISTNTKDNKPWFKNEDLAYEVVDSIYKYRSSYGYRLLAFVVMPNHLHLLILPVGAKDISEIVKEIKRTSSIEINKILGRNGPLWQNGFYDLVLQGEKIINGKIEYIHNNPVKAGLSETQEEYPFSSANERWEKDWDWL